MTTTDIQWSMYVESIDGATNGTLSSGGDSHVFVTGWTQEARFNVLAGILSIEIEDATKFYPKYQPNNPFGMGAKIIIYYEGIQKYIGWVYDHEPDFGPDKRSLKVKYKDKAGLLNHAAMWEDKHTQIYTRRMLLSQIESGSLIWGSPDISGSGTAPWAENYIVPIWSGSSTDDSSRRIPLSEYEILYDVGGIAWNNATVRFQGDSSSGIPFANVDAWGHIPYYNLADQTMRISNILQRAFEYPQESGGVGWTDGVDFVIQDTPNDVVNRLKWITDEGDGYISDLISWLYDNPAVGLAPSYQIHDYNGLGIVEAKLITQYSGVPKDIQFPIEAEFPSSIANIYSRCVVTNATPTRKDISRDALLNFGSVLTVPDVISIGESHEVRDYAVRTGFGFYRWGEFDVDVQLPLDKGLVKYFFDKPEHVDAIALNATWIWTGEEGFAPVLQGALNSIKLIHRNMIVSVEYSPVDGPGVDDWFPIHPELYLAEMDIMGGKDSWLIVQDIDLEDVYAVRLMINQPLFAKAGESNLGDAERIQAWFINEFRVLGKGKVINTDTGLPPEIRFVTNSGSSNRYRPDLGDQIINGTFTSSSGWNLGTGWTIATGKANKVSDGTGYLQQNQTVTSGAVYILEYEIQNHTVGAVTPVVGGTGGITRTGDGIFYELFTSSGSGTVEFQPTSTSRFEIDNVRVTKALDMYRPKLTDKLAYMGLPWKSLILEIPDVFDFSGSGSVGNKVMGTQLDWYSKENHWEVDIIPQPNIKLGDTVHHSRANTNYFTVTGFKIDYNGTDVSMQISLSDYETKIEGGES